MQPTIPEATQARSDQRYYASSYGRFNSPDPYMASGGPQSPASWNRYSYTRGDPVNAYDPYGLQDCNGLLNPQDCCLPSTQLFGVSPLDDSGCPDPDPSPSPGPGPAPAPSPSPDCSSSYPSYEVSFVKMTYGAASGLATTIEAGPGELAGQGETGTLAAAFIDWSATESGWGRDPDATQNGNWFGAGAGSWGGTANTNCRIKKLACWSVNWGTELQDILNFAPHTIANPNPSNQSYTGALQNALIIQNPTLGVSGIIQSIASFGFNSIPGYAAGAAKVDVVPIVNCLQSLGKI